jgi:hypothetical protein
MRQLGAVTAVMFMTAIASAGSMSVETVFDGSAFGDTNPEPTGFIADLGVDDSDPSYSATEGGGSTVDVTQSYTNFSGPDWLGFRLELIGSEDSRLAFVSEPAPSVSQSPSSFTIMDIDGVPTLEFDFADDPVGLGETLTVEFTLENPNSEFFTLAATPTPEPGMLAMLLSGAVALTVRRRC